MKRAVSAVQLPGVSSAESPPVCEDPMLEHRRLRPSSICARIDRKGAASLPGADRAGDMNKRVAGMYATRVGDE